jgi:hypothetical protein
VVVEVNIGKLPYTSSYFIKSSRPLNHPTYILIY